MSSFCFSHVVHAIIRFLSDIRLLFSLCCSYGRVYWVMDTAGERSGNVIQFKTRTVHFDSRLSVVFFFCWLKVEAKWFHFSSGFS